MPKPFQDALGNAWTPRVTCWTVARFEQETGVGLIQASEDFVSKVLKNQIYQVMRLSFYACEIQVKERSCTFEKFCESFQTQEQFEALMLSTLEAFADFFQSRSAEKKK